MGVPASSVGHGVGWSRKNSTAKLSSPSQRILIRSRVSQRRAGPLLTGKNEARPQEDGVATGVIEVGPRQPDGYGRGQDADGAELERTVDVHIDGP